MMQKKVKRSICSILLALIMISNFTIEVFAIEQNSSVVEEVVQLEAEVTGYNQFYESVPYATTFVDASITISFDSEGMHIGICTGMNGIASVVGVKDVEVQHKTGWFTWETVAVSTGGESYNTTASLCSLVFQGAVKGESYRVKCVHYGNVDGYREMEAETDWVTCEY